MDAFRLAYGVIMQDRAKERFDMILEPLQSLIQLALLSYCPIGTKLSICQNVLYVQEPTWVQSVRRTYNSDSKDHLVFLFSIIIRFHNFYGFMKEGSKSQKYLFNTLIELGKSGIDKLAQTYNHSGVTHLTQTLKMYRTMLDKPDVVTDEKFNDKANIETVFSKVENLYSKAHYEVIANMFKLLAADEVNHLRYRLAMNSALEPVTDQLQKWISDNVVF